MDFERAAEEIRRHAAEANSVRIKIAFFGQPGSGKSSLINAIIGHDIADVSESTDETKALETYQYQGLMLCDLPGYGTPLFPASDYFERFDIPQFDLILCATAGKFSTIDVEFFRRLRALGKTCLFVRNKVDSLYHRRFAQKELMKQVEDDLAQQLGAQVEVIFTSCRDGQGLDELERAMASMLAGVKRDRFFREAKAYSKEFLDQKREACKRYAIIVAAAAATVNLVPVPGLDFAADVGAILSLFLYIRVSFGVDESTISWAEQIYPQIAPLAKQVVRYVSREGIVLLLRQFGGRVIAAEAVKYVPFVGPVVAGTISFLTIKLITDNYIEDCYKLAEAELDQELRRSAC